MWGQLIRRGPRMLRLRRRDKAGVKQDGVGEGRLAPLLVSDARRTLRAGVISIITGTFFDDVIERLDFGPDELMSDISIIVCSLLVSWMCFAGIYAILTFTVFVRADGETLARWLRKSTPRTWFSRVVHLISGGSSTIWTVQGSLIAGIAVLVLSLVPELRLHGW